MVSRRLGTYRYVLVFFEECLETFRLSIDLSVFSKKGYALAGLKHERHSPYELTLDVLLHVVYKEIHDRLRDEVYEILLGDVEIRPHKFLDYIYVHLFNKIERISRGSCSTKILPVSISLPASASYV